MRPSTSACFLIFLFVTVAASAQNSDIEALSGLQFNFANPGARALGMGGTFLALADDASAAEANPAGLTILRKPEIALEGRRFNVAQTFNAGGTFPDVQRASFSTQSTRLSFASVTVPVRNFAIAVYYHEPVNYRNQFDLSNVFQPVNFFFSPTQGVLSEDKCTIVADCREYNSYPFFSNVSLRLKTWGVAGAWKSGALSLGASIKYQRFDEQAASDLGFAMESQNSHAHALTYSTGFKIALNDRTSIGGVYKRGARFDAPIAYDDISASDFKGSTTFHIPDLAGVGVAYRPIAPLTFSVDVVRVKYSELVDHFVSLFSNDTPASEFRISDATEIRAGVEYYLRTRIPIGLRAGWWRDPAHSIEYRGPLNSPDAVIVRTVYPGANTQNHYSVGFGFAWPKFQIDAAYDHSLRQKIGSISAVTRF